MKHKTQFYRPESQRKRSEVLLIAGKLFWQKGYKQTSIEDIAKAAEVNKATIYYYFDNKAAVLHEVALTSMEKLINKIEPILNSDLEPEEKLEASIKGHVEVLLTKTKIGILGIGQMERRNLPPKLLQSYLAVRDEYERNFRKLLQEGIEQGKFRYNDTKLASLFILGFLNSIFQWYKPSGRYSPEEVASEAYAFIIQAISPNTG